MRAIIAFAFLAPITARADTAVRIGLTREAAGGILSSASGVFIDGELAWRYAATGSVGVFAAVSASERSGDVSCTVGATPVDMTEHYDMHPIRADLGVRSTLHLAGGLFIGLGVGVEVSGGAQSLSGGTCFAAPSTAVAPVSDFHAGVTFPELSVCTGCALELFAVAGGTSSGPNGSGTAFLRVALGLRFR